MDPRIDGRLAARVREIATLEHDSLLSGGNAILTREEKMRILNIAADTLEEYIMASKPE